MDVGLLNDEESDYPQQPYPADGTGVINFQDFDPEDGSVQYARERAFVPRALIRAVIIRKKSQARLKELICLGIQMPIAESADVKG